MHLQPGEVFAGDFRIERPLARGGMGAVYIAEQLSTGRRRALKLMLPSLVENPRTRERFEQEARIASAIHSDHVVEVVAAGVDATSGAPWLAMELLEGETLSERVARAGPLDPSQTLTVFRQLCHALGAAHAAGLVHRDIKPENLFLATPRREGVPFTLKILDFGIAKLTENARAGGDATRALGSPLWMAPEQTSSTNVQAATDVWALGLVAFHCLTGRVYWRASNSEEATLHGLLREVVMDPLDSATGRATLFGVAHLIPAGFDSWFSHTVAREPSHRYPNATAALAALTPVLERPDAMQTVPAATWHSSVVGGPSATATNPALTSPVRSSKAGRWGAAILAVVLIGGIGIAAVAAVAIGIWYSQSSDASTASSSAAPGPTASSAPVDTPSATAPVQSGGDPRSTSASTRTGPKATASTATSASDPTKKSGVPPGWRPRGTTCVKGKEFCTINCCQKDELLSPFPECACYFKPPATGIPAGARPRNQTCVKGKEFCTVNCCSKGDFLSPFPECACYFLPPATGVPGQ